MRIMRDKADLYDRLEATEHQLLLMQGQTDTIGEWRLMLTQTLTSLVDKYTSVAVVCLYLQFNSTVYNILALNEK